MTAARSCYVYRYFDSCEPRCLLYVGRSLDPRSRNDKHRAGSPWHSLAGHQSVIEFATELDAADAEEAAILNEKPVFNKVVPGVRSTVQAAEARRRVAAYELAHPGVVLPDWPWAR